MSQDSRWARVSAEAGWVIAGQLLAFLGSFALIKVLTAELGPAAYGQLALGMSIAGVLHMFLYGPIEQTALRYVSVYRENARLGLLFSLLARAHRHAAILVLAVAACAGFAVHVMAGAGWAVLLLIAALFGAAGGANATLSSLQTAFRNRRAVAVFQAGDVWLRLGLAVTLVAHAQRSAGAALLGFALATAAIAGAQLLWLTRRRPPRYQAGIGERNKAMAELWAFGSPYVAFAGFAWLGSYSDRWLVLMFADEHAVGIYAALLQIANAPIALFLGITNQFLVPLIFDRAGSATTAQQTATSARLLSAAAAIYVLALLVIVAVAAAFAEPIVRLLTNAEFARRADVLWMLCAGLGLASIGQLLVVKGLARNRTREYILPKFVQVAALLLGAPVLITALDGLTGMGVSLCVSGAAYLVAVSWTNRHFFRAAP